MLSDIFYAVDLSMCITSYGFFYKAILTENLYPIGVILIQIAYFL